MTKITIEAKQDEKKEQATVYKLSVAGFSESYTISKEILLVWLKEAKLTKGKFGKNFLPKKWGDIFTYELQFLPYVESLKSINGDKIKFDGAITRTEKKEQQLDKELKIKKYYKKYREICDRESYIPDVVVVMQGDCDVKVIKNRQIKVTTNNMDLNISGAVEEFTQRISKAVTQVMNSGSITNILALEINGHGMPQLIYSMAKDFDIYAADLAKAIYMGIKESEDSLISIIYIDVKTCLSAVADDKGTIFAKEVSEILSKITDKNVVVKGYTGYFSDMGKSKKFITNVYPAKPNDKRYSLEGEISLFKNGKLLAQPYSPAMKEYNQEYSMHYEKIHKTKKETLLELVSKRKKETNFDKEGFKLSKLPSKVVSL